MIVVTHYSVVNGMPISDTIIVNKAFANKKELESYRNELEIKHNIVKDKNGMKNKYIYFYYIE